MSFFFCCFVCERERMKREIHSRQQNQNVAYIILEKTRTRFHASVRLAFAGYRRERNVRSFPAASRGSRREGRVVDRFSSFFSRCDFLLASLSLSRPPIPRPRKKKKSSSSNGDASRPSHRAGPSRFERAEYILPRRTNNKNRRRTQTTTQTTTTHSFFFVYVYV